MLAEYLPTLLFLIVATGIGIALIVIGNLVGPKKPKPLVPKTADSPSKTPGPTTGTTPKAAPKTGSAS